MINVTEVREVFRVGKTIGYTFKDGEVSTATMDSIEEAVRTWEYLYKNIID